MDESLQNESKTPVGDRFIRSYQTSSSTTSEYREEDEATTVRSFRLLQQAESLSELFLAAHKSEGSSRAHEKTQTLTASTRSHRTFAQSADITTEPEPVNRAFTSVPWHDARWTSLCRPNQRKSAHQAFVFNVLLSLEGMKKPSADV